MPRIAVDCRFAGTHSGLGRYTRELTARLVARGAAEYALLVRSPDEPWLAGLPAEAVRADIPHYSLAEQRLLPVIIGALGADVLLSPHFNVPLRCPVPYALTIHDLILHRYPNAASVVRRCAYRFVLRNALRRAAAVIAVSPFAGREVTGAYPAAASKLRVIEEGVSPHFSPRPDSEQEAALARYGIRRPFFLYVGNAKQHKNVPVLLDAFRRSGTDASLVLVTGGPEARRLALPDGSLLLPQVDECDLPPLYSAARACVTASLYEGFCLPLVEALACGCPVIAPRRTAIPEVVGDGPAVRLVEPVADALAAALRDPPADRTPVRRWDWDQTARRTEELLLSLIR